MGRKEIVPLVVEHPGPSRPGASHAPRYRFFRPPQRVYKPSALVDRVWTITEREKLLDAVSKVAPDDYASISDIIGNTKTPAEVKDYLKRIQIRSKEIESRRQNNLFDFKRDPHSRHLVVKEEGEAIERWLRVIDHLVSDNDTPDFSKAIPDVFAVIANLEQNPDPGTIRGKKRKKSGDNAAADASTSSTGAAQEKSAENNEEDDDDDTVDDSEDAVAPINYKVIYEYLYALLRGLTPPALDPIESWVILDLISDTATELKGSNLDAQKDYLRCIYRDYCNKTLNLKWSNTSKMTVPITEELAVKRKRQKMAGEFAKYLGKTTKTEEEEEEEQPGDGVNGEEEELEEPKPSTSSGVGTVVDIKPGTLDDEIPGLKPAEISDDPTFHNIMIGGLVVTKGAEDLGSLFTMNPLGVPNSLFNPKKPQE